MLYAAIRVRGRVNVNPDIKDTMRFLRLNQVNHCVLVPDTPQYAGMLKKVKDYITWGEVSPTTVRELITKRGRLTGGNPVTPTYIKKESGFKDVNALTKAICKGGTELRKLPGMKPLFRLSPPRKGYEGIKRSFVEGGALGYRGKKINDLIGRMI